MSFLSHHIYNQISIKLHVLVRPNMEHQYRQINGDGKKSNVSLINIANIKVYNIYKVVYIFFIRIFHHWLAPVNKKIRLYALYI